MNFVGEKIKKKRGKESLASVNEDLFESIIASDVATSNGIGCDNMTCVIIEFKK